MVAQRGAADARELVGQGSVGVVVTKDLHLRMLDGELMDGGTKSLFFWIFWSRALVG